jgi:hypothetical protein
MLKESVNGVHVSRWGRARTHRCDDDSALDNRLQWRPEVEDREIHEGFERRGISGGVQRRAGIALFEDILWKLSGICWLTDLSPSSRGDNQSEVLGPPFREELRLDQHLPDTRRWIWDDNLGDRSEARNGGRKAEKERLVRLC